MRVTRRSRLWLRSQNWLFALLFLAAVGLAAWLSTRYAYRADWTYGHRNSLSAASVALLKTLNGPLAFTAYARDNPELRGAIRRFVGRYQAADKNLTLRFINPDTDPQAARAAGITTDGELVIGYQGRSEKVTQIDETSVTNAIERLARSSARYLVFLSGDGERAPLGDRNFDLGNFGRQLENKGFKIETLNLAATPSIPQNTAVLVIAGPQAKLLPGAVKIIDDYVAHGGNLLWLADPGSLYGLESLAQRLGVSFGHGTVVDPDSQLFGITNPTVVLVAKYDPVSAITRDFNTLTAFVGATSVIAKSNSGWQAENFLQTLPRSWLETGKLQGEIKYDRARGDVHGPLTIGVALTREVKSPLAEKPDSKKTASRPQEQRVVVVGDGDFLSNAYLGSGGNLTLGLNIMNWLAHEDSFININPRPAPDLTLTLSKTAESLISIGFLFALPLALLAAGLLIWTRRRRA